MKMHKKIFSRLDRLVRSNQASAAIEFAIVAPVLFLMLIAIVELGLVFFTYSILEGATDIASRIGKTGYEDPAFIGTREQYIVNQIDSMSGGFIDTSKLNIDITSYSTFEEIGQAGEGQANDPGGGDAIVVYKVTYPWQLFTPLMREIMGDANGDLDITAVATVRNEPF